MLFFDEKVMRVIDRVDQLRRQVNDHWQIPADEALVLAQLVRAGRCRSICEIGHSYGFSTLHLAAAARDMDGHVHSIDSSPKKHEAACRHLAEAGLQESVTFHLGTAQEILPAISLKKPFDFVFIDAVKQQCLEYLEAVMPLLAKPAMLATDNTLTHARELESFVKHLRQLPMAHSCGVPVGNGFELTLLG